MCRVGPSYATETVWHSIVPVMTGAFCEAQSTRRDDSARDHVGCDLGRQEVDLVERGQLGWGNLQVHQCSDRRVVLRRSSTSDGPA
jgi:hypothetical protein